MGYFYALKPLFIKKLFVTLQPEIECFGENK
jgi:hypothetical protein